MAKKLAFDLIQPTTVLDFESGITELIKLLTAGVQYIYVEEEAVAVKWIEEEYPDTVRIWLENVPGSKYNIIFDMDSLEHNDNYPELIDRLALMLADNGVLVTSGPTENFLYRFGRRLAGFSGHYHQTTLQHINHYVDDKMTLLKRMRLPHGLSLFLFVLSCWKQTR